MSSERIPNLQVFLHLVVPASFVQFLSFLWLSALNCHPWFVKSKHYILSKHIVSIIYNLDTTGCNIWTINAPSKILTVTFGDGTHVTCNITGYFSFVRYTYSLMIAACFTANCSLYYWYFFNLIEIGLNVKHERRCGEK